MDLPPSGWYPDPRGVPGLLRWWDGSAWTGHTHQDAGTTTAGGAEPAGTVLPNAAEPTTVQPTTVQPATVHPTAVQPATVHPTAVQPATVHPTAVQPAMLPAPVQPTAVQPTAVQYGGAAAAGEADAASWVPPGLPGAGSGADEHGANGTQVLFLGDDEWSAPGGPGGAAPPYPYGYHRVRRRRRMWLASSLVAGTVAALAVIALVVNAMGRSSGAPVTQTSSTPAAPATTAAPTTTASASATAGTSMLTDGQSGLSYAQLASPWQPSCPSVANNQSFTWTAGESAVAGQVNGGQTTWYGVACSGPLPQQYGYNGVADLENVATQLANQFSGSYYNGLNHTYQQEVSQPVQVSGHAAWEIKFLITYTDPQGQGVSWNDELAAVVVADTGSGASPAVFYTSVPNNLNEHNVGTLLSSLQLGVTPQAGGSPSPGGQPSQGPPGPGNGNGNGNGN